MPAAKKTTAPKTKSKSTAKPKKKAAVKKSKLKIVRASAYKGNKIEVVAEGKIQKVQIEGKMIHTDRDPDSGAYVCPDLPYRVFGSLEEIAQAMVDREKEG